MVVNMKETVLCYLFKDNKCLMLLRNKKEDDMNHGKYIGIGGKIEVGETPEVALIREVREETSLFLMGFTKRGIILFQNDDYSEVMHLYQSKTFMGELKECDEGHLEWIDTDEMLTLPMWEGDKAYLPLLKTEKYFKLKIKYRDKELVSVTPY